MRKIVSTTFITLDGVMQAPGGPDEDRAGGFEYGGWTAPLSDEVVDAAVNDAMREPFDLLLGRRTYEIFAAYWPFIEDHPIADRFNSATKFVATSSGIDATWKNTHVLEGDVAARLGRLKQEDGPNLFVWGSSVLFQTLLANNLLDEIELMVFPVVLGAGKRLFSEGSAPRSFDLVSNQTSPNGVQINRYRLAGAVKTGSVDLDEPSELEIARREREHA